MAQPAVLASPVDKPPLLQGRTGVLAVLRKHIKRLLGQVAHDPQVVNLGRHLLTLGFTQAPLHDLEHLVRTARNRHTRTAAAIELAKWYMRPQAAQDHRRALDWIRAAQESVDTRPQRRHLIILETLCLYHLDEPGRAQAVLDSAVRAGGWVPDLALAEANLAPDPHERVARINTALAAHGIPEIGLRDAGGLPAYDRLICRDPLPACPDGPKVSVILAAYEAGATLETALRALQAQTWRNLEILVVDDASPSRSTARIVRDLCADDARVRLIEMTENGGAYVARNRALDEATGEYVTLHDADDWSHPRKIETQVAFLRAHSQVLGCASEQARATDDLEFLRWSGEGRCIMTNYSSFMFRRAEMRRHFGYWDTVRLSADNELIRRMRAKFGQKAVNFMRTGPLAFQRYAETTMTSDPVLGINGFLYGARQEYLEAHTLWHRSGGELRYTGRPEDRPFPAPGIMCPACARIAAQDNRFDLIVATDFRPSARSAGAALDDITAFQDRGLRVAVFPLYRYLGAPRHIHALAMHDDTRLALWARGVRILCHGEAALCRCLLIEDPACIAHPQRYVPEISADAIGIVADAAQVAAECPALLPAVTAAVRECFGGPARWFPRDRAARQLLEDHGRRVGHPVVMAGQDWDAVRRDIAEETACPVHGGCDAGQHACQSTGQSVGGPEHDGL